MTRRFLCTCMDTAEEIIAADDQKVHHCTTLLMMNVVREVLHAVNFFIHAYNLDEGFLSGFKFGH